MSLLGKLVRGLGGDNVDFRLRQSDFSADGRQAGAPWLGMKISQIAALDRVLVVGSFLRKDHPLLANRLRQAAKRGTQVSLIHSADDNPLMPVRAKAIVAPGELPAMLAQVVKAVAEAKGKAAPAALDVVTASDRAKAIAASLVSGKSAAILLGNFAQQHPQAAQLRLLAQELAGLLECAFGFTGEAANSVGGHLAACLPANGGLNASAMLAKPLKAYLLLGVEPQFDCANPAQAMRAVAGADMVVALVSHRGQAADYADVMLPVAPFTETSGSYVNTEGRLQSFNGVVRPLGDTRPAWKVLRVLGNLLGLGGFDYDTSEAVRDEVCKGADFASRCDNNLSGLALQAPVAAAKGLQRVADVPIYATDALVRRAESLQLTADAKAPTARMNAAQLDSLGLTDGQRVRIAQDGGEVALVAKLDAGVPAGCVRVAAAHASTAALGAMFGELSVVKA
jgi:NADH-quinone oxidoreductase subunit G